MSGLAPHCHWVYSAKTRYRQKDAPCSLDSVTAEQCTVDFAEPQWAITPGQSVVVYESQVCLGGGIIESAERPRMDEDRPRECPQGTEPFRAEG